VLKKKVLASLATASLIALLCADGVTAQRGAVATGAQDYLNRAADALLALKSAQFTLKREGAPAVLDANLGLLFSAADCLYAAPDRVSCNVRVALKNGSVLQITRVWVPEGAFQSNPLTKQFARLPPDPNFSIGAIFARTGIPEILRTGVVKPQLVNKAERLGSRDTVHLRGDVSGKNLGPLMGTTVKPDLTYPVDLWMEERTANVVQLHVTEPDNNGWLIELFAPNESVNIPTPQVPAAPTPAPGV
jgi:hypothetical protein